ncbi:MAG: cytidine deaminase [Armatimonadota bacterium]
MIAAHIADELVAAARQARERAYAPYSNFAVGAAVRCADGRVFAGCNIENASSGATVCAERVALFAAVAAGCGEIEAVAIVGPGRQPLPPCGICRQVMVELAPHAAVIMAGAGERLIRSVAELMPEAFGPGERRRGAT